MGALLGRGELHGTVIEAPGHSADDGRKDDASKARCDLLPPRALEAVARVLAYGASKYGANNWRLVPDLRARYTAATLRHLLAAMRGEVHDADTGEDHLAHAACCVLFMLELAERTRTDAEGAR